MPRAFGPIRHSAGQPAPTWARTFLGGMQQHIRFDQRWFSRREGLRVMRATSPYIGRDGLQAEYGR